MYYEIGMVETRRDIGTKCCLFSCHGKVICVCIVLAENASPLGTITRRICEYGESRLKSETSTSMLSVSIKHVYEPVGLRDNRREIGAASSCSPSTSVDFRETLQLYTAIGIPA